MERAQHNKPSLDARARPADGTLHRTVDGEVVLLSLTGQTYHGLDAVGSRMWQLLLEDPLLRSVRDAIVREYDVAPEQAEADLLQLMDELHARSLIVLE